MKLNKNKVAQIKQDILSGDTQPAIAKKHGVSRSIISDIATGRAWASVPWPSGEAPRKKGGGQRKALPQHDPDNERIQELEAEVAHLLAERNHAQKCAKASKKEHGLFKAIVREMDLRVRPFTALPPARSFKAKKSAIAEHLVMHLSDGHHDQIVTPEECGGFEEHNFPISCRRAEHYVDTTIEWTQQTLGNNFNFTTLWVLAYGDHTSGEIHDHVNRSAFGNQFKNSFAIGQLHGLMYRDLAPNFDVVNVVYLPGNHGRRSVKKDFHGAHNNWDYLVAECARMHCRDIPNVNFIVPNAFSINLDINGVGFNVSHGDDVRGNMGIPFYGMVRRQKGLIALNSVQGGPRIRYFVMGHHHVSASLQDVDGELLVNGPWVGTDSYSYNSFSGFREPSQWIHGVHPKHGITWRLNVHLRTPDEKKGPQRYIIDV